MFDGTTSYVTTDLVLFSSEDLTALAAALAARGLDVRDGPRRIDETEWYRIAGPQWYWRFQAGGEESHDDPEPEVAALLAAVEALDLGYDCGTRPFSVRHDLSAGTLARLAAASGLLRLTLYALDPDAINRAGPCDAPTPARDHASGSS